MNLLSDIGNSYIGRIVLSAFITILFACAASSPVARYPGFDDKHRVENNPLPERPDSEKIPSDKDWVKPLRAGECAESDGILLSPEKAVRAKLWQEGYNSVRTLYEIDRQIWQQHRIVYEERLNQANSEVARLSPSWWDENKSSILWAGGFLMGAATSISIVYALDKIHQ